MTQGNSGLLKPWDHEEAWNSHNNISKYISERVHAHGPKCPSIQTTKQPTKLSPDQPIQLSKLSKPNQSYHSNLAKQTNANPSNQIDLVLFQRAI